MWRLSFATCRGGNRCTLFVFWGNKCCHYLNNSLHQQSGDEHQSWKPAALLRKVWKSCFDGNFLSRSPSLTNTSICTSYACKDRRRWCHPLVLKPLIFCDQFRSVVFLKVWRFLIWNRWAVPGGERWLELECMWLVHPPASLQQWVIQTLPTDISTFFLPYWPF